ncbi:unnamed protein product [Caenorhabditis angaria]|uniref:Serpentine receptor class r-10 n=1 Tax=Caenorhabditis angaria TaxID=860376 RepID=A0A9P1IZT2_9PELO|nr:unnamed protein product [Caenorhabditis angaria]
MILTQIIVFYSQYYEYLNLKIMGKTWTVVQHQFQIFSTLFAVPLNIFLIFLIIKKSPKALGSYKYLLAYTSFFEIVYSIVNLIGAPCFYSHGSAIIMFIETENSIFSPLILNIFNSLYCGTFGTVLGLFSIQFIYRYLVSIRSEWLISFRPSRIYIWFSFPLLSGLTWSFTTYFLATQSDLKTKYLETHVLHDLDVNIHKTVYLGLLLFPKNSNGTRYIHVESVIVNSIENLSLSISWFVILYFGIKCYLEMRKSMDQSLAHRKLQRQLFIALVIQTMIPLVLLHIPVFFYYLLAIIEINCGIFGGIITITIALYPAIDPLPNFFIIKNYRLAIKQYFCLTKRSETFQIRTIRSRSGSGLDRKATLTSSINAISRTNF